MIRFIEQYHARGESSTVDLISSLDVVPDGGTLDPTQLYDFLACAKAVLEPKGNGE